MKRLKFMTDCRVVLVKPLRGTARGNMHIADWRYGLFVSALCDVDTVSIKRYRCDAAGRPGVEFDPAPFDAGLAVAGVPAETTCRRCRSIARHLSATGWPRAFAHRVALAENAQRDRTAARAATSAPAAAPDPAPPQLGYDAPGKAVRATFKGHGRPGSGFFFGTDREPIGAGRAATFRPAATGTGTEVVDAATGESIATVRGAGRMWLAPTVTVTEEQLAAARITAAHVEAELGAFIYRMTSGRDYRPSVGLTHSSLSYDRSRVAQRGQSALTLALAERIAAIQDAYEADEAQRVRDRDDRRARIIAERAAEADPREIVIIPCGGRKLDRPAPAGELYTGSYHRACARAAATRGGRVLILSALHGLIDPRQVIAPYELRMGQPGSVTARQVRDQAGALGVLDAPRVTVLAGRRYAALVRQVWPDADDMLNGTRGIGEQLARLALIIQTPRPARGRRAPAPAGRQIPGQLELFAQPDTAADAATTPAPDAHQSRPVPGRHRTASCRPAPAARRRAGSRAATRTCRADHAIRSGDRSPVGVPLAARAPA